MRKVKVALAGRPSPHKGSSIGHMEYCVDPAKCRGNCKMSPEYKQKFERTITDYLSAIVGGKVNEQECSWDMTKNMLIVTIPDEIYRTDLEKIVKIKHFNKIKGAKNSVALYFQPRN